MYSFQKNKKDKIMLNFASYTFRGTKGTCNQFCRSHYPKDSTVATGSSNVYNGKLGNITPIGETQQEVVIDSAVKVKTVAQKIREKSQKFWKQMKAANYSLFSVTLISGILAGAAAITVAAVLPELWAVAAGVSAVSLVILGISGFFLAKGITASKRSNEWYDDPTLKAQSQRIQVGREGFYKAFSSNLKGSIVSDKEVENLWYKDMDYYVDQFGDNNVLLDSSKVSRVRQFMKKSPIASAPLKYAFSKVEPSISKVNTKFESVKSNFDEVKAKTRQLKAKINSQKADAILDNDRHRDSLLLPYKLMVQPRQSFLEARRVSLQMEILTANNRKHAIRVACQRPQRTVTAVDRNGRVIPGQRQAVFVPTQEYILIDQSVSQKNRELQGINAELNRINLVYTAMTAPIRQMHARNEAKIKNWAKGEINKIEQDEDKLMTRFFPPIQELLKEYANRNKTNQADKKEVKPVEVAVELKAPPIEKEYTAVAYNDSWKDVIKEFEWKSKQNELVGSQHVPSKFKNK